MMLKLRNGFLREVRRGVRASRATADAQLRAAERACVLSDGAVARVDVAQLPANRPIEDFYASAKCISSNAFLFGVFDGHGGPSCSRHVSSRLFDYICASVLPKHIVVNVPLHERIQWLFSSADPQLSADFQEEHMKNVEEFHRRAKNDSETSTVRKALQAAFTALDDDIAKGALPDAQGRVSRSLASVAASGSCAVVAHLREDHIHVANVGDSAAVLGVCNHGIVSARLLSRPHCIDNTDEVKRLRSAHPIAESTTILRAGRLLGELYPLRAFGDVRYKWPAELQKTVLEPLGDTAPQGLLTPPYLTALPEVLYHRLTPNDRFLVLASDGLWEWLEPDIVVRLISDHAVGAQTLTAYQPQPGITLAQVRDELRQRFAGESKKPLDENSATHVLRHALGGCSGGTETQYRRLTDMLQLPAGMARNYRDDITIIVIHFNQSYIESLAYSES
uniref:[Pyruvate dehydrogenase acetyl-transferring-phosphatase 1 n=1 Tax=Ascaris suum TaxID=6253 RepID=F1L0G4_ASCSU